MFSILVPIDFSKTSLNAVKYAVNFAQKFNSTITLYHSLYVSVSEMDSGMANDILRERKSDLHSKLSRVALQFAEYTYEQTGKPVEINTSMGEGLPSDSIKTLSEGDQFNLIIMGTQGERGSDEQSWGSITTNVTSQVETPVLVIPLESTFKPYDKVVYATVFDKDDIPVIDEMLAFSEKIEASLVCVQITSTDATEQKRAGQNQKLLENYYWFSTIEQLNFQVRANDSVEAGIKEFIQAENADLLIVHPDNREFVGNLDESVTRNLLLHIEMPTLVAKNIRKKSS
ncbi:universal stress protein [Flexithrix dorotheae]|uniref:universal stress protein n=1 Tax=Flexithrix dorotheae TaxID=70993 RepID=UPI000361B61B|nr:universal stress protein [Flexithrix dorotheae]